MQSDEIRLKFLKFFEERGHKIIPSSSLVPENDPSVLFTTAGMHPLVPFLLGEKHPEGRRLTNVQKCLRTDDIDEVGDYCHHTFFEMLGNWSLGDYFKKDVIGWSYEFLTSPEWLGLDKNRIAVSVFKGDEDAPFDNEAFDAWKNLGINEKRIAKLPKKNNWWGPAGITGPCGPDTEMFYWVGDINNTPESFNDDNPLWLEIWNDVFMQYDKTKDGKFKELAQKNIDTGMGLERILAVVNGFDDNYRTELFWPIIGKIEQLSNKKYEDELKAMRIIADHIRSSVFIIGAGIAPAKREQGYILRRLLRRAVRYADTLGMNQGSLLNIADVVVEKYGTLYKEILEKKGDISLLILDEEMQFRKTLEYGLREFEKGVDPFVLATTYGFPIELTQELAKEKGIEINIEDFKKKMAEHQKLSQTAAAGMFKGGLSSTGEMEKKYHTATHLLLAALRIVLGGEIVQKGSNITAERMRFDFNWSEKVLSDKLKEVENLVNQKIIEKIPVEMLEMPKDEARKIVTTLSFDLSKYGDTVKVYKIADFSTEFCGGPHVKNTGELGHFKITKEEASSQGVRRIKAVLE